MKLFLYAGLPRTATTVLQKDVFPRLREMHYLGKHSDNRCLPPGEFNPLELARSACRRHKAGDPEGMETIRCLLRTVTFALISSNSNKRGTADTLCRLWAACVAVVEGTLNDKPLLYSDESLVESTSGLVANPVRSDVVPLEQLHQIGFLEKVSLSIVLRDPAEFLRASYYKTMEFKHASGAEPISFDRFIALQLALYERRPSASRIFLCTHRAAARHFQSLCPTIVVTNYRDLIAAKHVIDTLLGVRTGEPPLSLGDLPRENNSWREREVNEFILGAAGVPRGMTIESYAQTFFETLARYSLDKVFKGESLESTRSGALT